LAPLGVLALKYQSCMLVRRLLRGGEHHRETGGLK
jgi:hypothetical protein